VALAFGLTLLTMAYAIGHISGCHINPAVSFGLWAGGRFPGSELAPYVIAQVLGGIFAAAVLYVIASGTAGFSLAGGFASNGYGAHSPGGYSLPSALVCEVVMTLMFLFVIMGAADPRVSAGFGSPMRRSSRSSRTRPHPPTARPSPRRPQMAQATSSESDLAAK
jgi:aquaporin Z